MRLLDADISRLIVWIPSRQEHAYLIQGTAFQMMGIVLIAAALLMVRSTNIASALNIHSKT